MATLKLDVSANPNKNAPPQITNPASPDSNSWSVKVGDTLEVKSMDGGSYRLWIYTGAASGHSPKGLLNSGGSTSWNEADKMYSITLPTTPQSVSVLIQPPEVLQGKPKSSFGVFGVGVSQGNEPGPRGHGGGSGSAGTLNVSPG